MFSTCPSSQGHLTKQPSTIRKLAMSLLRIGVASAVVFALLLLALALAVRQPTFGRYPFPAGPRADPALLRKHVAFLTTEASGRNTKHPERLNRAADYIAEAFREAGAQVSEQPYQAGRTTCRNIIARFGPSSGPILVVGAHYDVFADLPGADDNASGVAGLLELARLLGARPVSSPVELVAFSTEEPPFFDSPQMGSAVHARSLRDSGASVKAMICLEMIGYYSARQPNRNFLTHVIYPRAGDFICAAGRWSDRRLAREIKKAFSGATTVPGCSYSGPAVFIGADLSDHRNYWAEGWPAVMLTDTSYLRNPNYHSSRDTAETLDYDRMAGVVDGLLSAAVHLSASPN